MQDPVCVSIIVAAGLRYGCARKASPQRLRRVEEFLAQVPVLPFDVPADTAHGDIRAELEAAGRPIGSNNLLIAAHACALAATMVTANVDAFRRVRGLTVENWLASAGQRQARPPARMDPLTSVAFPPRMERLPAGIPGLNAHPAAGVTPIPPPAPTRT